jgi:hypothetical protein
MRRIFVMILALALGGCATKWSRPGATDAEFKSTEAACVSRAGARFMPEMQRIQITGGYSGYTTPMQIPPAFMDVDVNTGARNQDVRACFFEAGWTPDK